MHLPLDIYTLIIGRYVTAYLCPRAGRTSAPTIYLIHFDILEVRPNLYAIFLTSVMHTVICMKLLETFTRMIDIQILVYGLL